MAENVTDQDEAEATYALTASATESSAIDSLLVKLATGGLGFSIALGAFESDQQTGWLVASWFTLLLCVSFILGSKYFSVEALRAFYLSKKDKDLDTRNANRLRAKRLDWWVMATNYAGGLLFLLGAGFMVCHVVAVGV